MLLRRNPPWYRVAMKSDYAAFTFDIDGTLVVSKQPITSDVAEFINELLRRGKTVGLISGGKLPIFHENVVAFLEGSKEHWGQLYLMPTCGAAMLTWKNGEWQEEYAHRITPGEFALICAAFDTAFGQTSFPRPEAQWGEQIEHRDTQATFSAFGQRAPVEVKQEWDVSNSKKRELVALLSELLPEFSVKGAGMTSVDVTHRGIDKQYGIERFMEYSGHTAPEILFAGDALYEGGNDFVVTLTGVDVCQVEHHEDLLQKLGYFVR